GTTAGTVMKFDINSSSYGSSYPDFLRKANGKLFFQANDGTNGKELWQTDGTTASIVMDINSGFGSSDPIGFIELGGKLYFSADDGTNGSELWQTDGTTTSMVMDINPSGFSNISNFAELGGKLYFSADDGTNGTELWQTDGTTTSMVMDINSGIGSSSPSWLKEFGGKIYFRADDGINGIELWQTDGTTTSMSADISSGGASSSPYLFTEFGGDLFFVAKSVHNDYIYDRKLFKLGNCSPSSNIATSTVQPIKNNTLSFSSQTQTGNPNQTCRCDIFGNLMETTEANGVAPVTGDISTYLWIDNVQESFYVKRHFEITPATNPSAATANTTLYFTQQEFDDFNAVNAVKLPTGPSDATGIANLLIEKRPGQSSDGSGHYSTYPVGINIDPIDTDIVWNATDNRWEVTVAVTGFSGFWAKTQTPALPVELTYFQAEKKGQTSLLTWETASEENNRGFHIERSQNGFDFETIGWVDGKGTTTEVQNYYFIDEKPMTGINYYRLIQEDFDGATSPSDVRKVEFGTKTSVSLFPNPVRTGHGISLQIITEKEGTTDIHIIDVAGKQISSTSLELEAGMNNTTLETRNLAEGIYFLRLMNNGEMQTLKFSVSH
ncbi:MAG: ELWxxDGT repeat protein, partial [Saprospiraceae bacterium]